MESEKCSFCGAVEGDNFGLGPKIFKCATSNGHQSWACHQISALQRQNQELRGWVERAKPVIEFMARPIMPLEEELFENRDKASTLIADLDRLGEGEKG